MTSKFLNEQQASDYIGQMHGLKVAPRTLRKQRSTGGGPKFRHFGRWPVYTTEDLDDYVMAKLSEPKRSTSDAGGIPGRRRGRRKNSTDIITNDTTVVAHHKASATESASAAAIRR